MRIYSFSDLDTEIAHLSEMIDLVVAIDECFRRPRVECAIAIATCALTEFDVVDVFEEFMINNVLVYMFSDAEWQEADQFKSVVREYARLRALQKQIESR